MVSGATRRSPRTSTPPTTLTAGWAAQYSSELMPHKDVHDLSITVYAPVHLAVEAECLAVLRLLPALIWFAVP